MRYFCIVLISASLLACASQSTDDAVLQAPTMTAVEARSAVEAQNAVFKTAFESKDPQALAALYTTDGMIIPPDGPNATGQEAIAAYWGPVMDLFASATITTEEAVPFGEDLIVERSSVELFDAEGTQVGNAKAMILWARDGGVWKMHRDIWNYGE